MARSLAWQPIKVYHLYKREDPKGTNGGDLIKSLTQMYGLASALIYRSHIAAV